jgi:hypothetical protein
MAQRLYADAPAETRAARSVALPPRTRGHRLARPFVAPRVALLLALPALLLALLALLLALLIAPPVGLPLAVALASSLVERARELALDLPGLVDPHSSERPRHRHAPVVLAD